MRPLALQAENLMSLVNGLSTSSGPVVDFGTPSVVQSSSSSLMTSERSPPKNRVWMWLWAYGLLAGWDRSVYYSLGVLVG